MQATLHRPAAEIDGHRPGLGEDSFVDGLLELEPAARLGVQPFEPRAYEDIPSGEFVNTRGSLAALRILPGVEILDLDRRLLLRFTFLWFCHDFLLSIMRSGRGEPCFTNIGRLLLTTGSMPLQAVTLRDSVRKS